MAALDPEAPERPADHALGFTSHSRALRRAATPATWLNPARPIAALWRERRLVRHLLKREIAQRYRGSIGGLLWSFVMPLAMLATYTFVFGVVFEARFGDAAGFGGSSAGFALLLYAGILVYAIFQETLGAAPTLILANVNFVKRVVFPLEVLPVVKLGAALVHAAIGIGALLLAALVVRPGISPTVWLFPLVLAPVLFFTLGLAWFLASLGTYVRDIGQILNLCLTILFFLTPIFYPIERLPEGVQPLVRANPMATFVEGARATLLAGDAPDWRHLGVATILSLAVFQAGWIWFMKTKRGFADVV